MFSADATRRLRQTGRGRPSPGSARRVDRVKEHDLLGRRSLFLSVTWPVDLGKCWLVANGFCMILFRAFPPRDSTFLADRENHAHMRSFGLLSGRWSFLVLAAPVCAAESCAADNCAARARGSTAWSPLRAA